jgi:hypothetical protein
VPCYSDFISGKTSITGQRKGSSASRLPLIKENSIRRDITGKQIFRLSLDQPRFISSDKEKSTQIARYKIEQWMLL